MTILEFTDRVRRADSNKRTIPLAQAVAAFVVDLCLDGCGKWTIKQHMQELRRYGRWLEEHNLLWQDILEEALHGYARARAHLGTSAGAATICTLRVFYDWAVAHRHVTGSPAACLKIPGETDAEGIDQSTYPAA